MRDLKLQPRLIKIIFIKATQLHLLLCFKGRSGIPFHLRNRKIGPALRETASHDIPLVLCITLLIGSRGIALNTGVKEKEGSCPLISGETEASPTVYVPVEQDSALRKCIGLGFIGTRRSGKKASLKEIVPELCLILSVGIIQNTREAGSQDRRNPQEHFVKIILYLKDLS